MSCSRGCCPDQRSHYLSLSISAAATPTRSSHIGRAKAQESLAAKDYDAMQHLKKEGIVPKSSMNVHELVAKAESKEEIEAGRLMSKEERTIRSEVG